MTKFRVENKGLKTSKSCSMKTNDSQKKYLFAILFMVSLIAMTTAQVAIYPSHDSYTFSSNTSQNFGNDRDLKVKKSNSGKFDRYAFLSFDTSSLTGEFQQIVLKITQLNTTNAGVLVDTFGGAFNEASLTWSNQPNNFTKIAAQTQKEGAATYFDVTEYVSQILTTNNIANFRIYSDVVTSSTITFASSENATKDVQPQLIFLQSKTSTEGGPSFEFDDIVVDVVDDNGFYNNQSWDSTILTDTNNYTEEVDMYGGLVSCNSNYEGTGFFRVQRIKGVWHMIDPLGNLFYTLGVNSVTEGGNVNLPKDLIELGVNTLGSWSDETIKGMPYCPRLNALVKFKNVRTDKTAWNADVLPVFESDFESYLEEKMPGWLEDYKNDPWVLGYFMDNELKFSGTQLEDSLGLISTDPQFQKANEFMIARYGSNYSLKDITDKDESDYVGIVAEKYFSAVSNAIRKVDPNHLILGSRINGNVRYRPTVIEAAGNHIDVLSINYYREWEPQQDALDLWADNTDIPWFTSEFYTKGDNTNLDNRDGAGWTVATQNDRAKHYENWVLRSMQDPNCVGLHWFRYNDNNGSNKGLLNENKNSWYTALTNSFSQVNNVKYALREHILQTANSSGCNTGNEQVFSDIFIPDPDKRYYIDNPELNLRLAATSTSTAPFTTAVSTTGIDVEWQFVSKGNGYWHIRRAGGGTRAGLRSNNTSNADMHAISSDGGWSYYEITPSASKGTFYLTLPDGPSEHNRLQMIPSGDVKMISSSNGGVRVSFKLTEVSSGSKNNDEFDAALMDDIKVYPNPAINELNISNVSENLIVEVVDIMGRKIKSFEKTDQNTMTIDVSGFNPGVYFVNTGYVLKKFIKK